MADITIPLAFAAGALSFLSPCVLPLVPVYLSYLSGNAVTDEKETGAGTRLLDHALCFVAGFTLVFVGVFGVPTTLFGESLRANADVIARIGGAVVVLFGLHVLGLFKLRVLNVTRQWHLGHGMAPGYLRSGLIGVAFAAGWTPCIGPLLAAVISMAMVQPSQGMLYALVYASGMAVPFLGAAFLLSRRSDSLKRLNRHAHWISKVSGMFLIVVGALLFSGEMARMNALFIQWTPDWLIDHL